MSKFDRELTLVKLLDGINRDKLHSALSALAGAGFRLLDAGGAPLVGGAIPEPGALRLPLALDLEPLGYLEGVGDGDTLRAAAALLELLLRAGARYRVASTLISADYEARYKALAAEVEQRVRAQVQSLDAAQCQLYQAEKLASVGQLAAGVAHEINNPIGFIRSNLNTGRDYLARIKALAPQVDAAVWRAADMAFMLDDFTQLIDESIAGADRIARIVTDLKGFSNIDGAEEAMVDLNENIRAVANVVEPRLHGRIQLKLELEPLPRLLCLPAHLNQVLLNLLTNAFQSIAAQGNITVTSGVVDGHIRIRVSDDGCGIPADILRRIFEPFFTTREVGAGTGLGLTVCRDIVQAHGGRIEVESKVDKGTTFSVYLPLL